MKKQILFLIAFSGLPLVSFSQTTNYSYTGSEQIYVVPSCVTEIEITTNGAQGNNAVAGATGGLGGTATGRLAVNGGDTLYIYVGGQNGYNGGGLGGQTGNSDGSGIPGTLAPNGGGASDVRVGGTALTDRIIVAGGGGGAGENGVWTGCQVAGPSGNGGNGGDLTGSNGGFGVGNPCNCGGGGGEGGFGGTPIAGGLHGAYHGSTACLRSSWGAGQDGSLGLGGNGSLAYHNGTGGGGGGGGGYFGGGSGGNGSDTTPGGGGGGGSSFTGTLTSSSTTGGTNSGNGSVVIAVTVSSVPAEPTGLSGITNSCDGDTLTFTVNSQANTSDYTWTLPNGGTVLSGQGTTSITALGGIGTGDIEVVANNACGSSTAAILSITVNALPIVDLGNDVEQCGGTVILDAGIGSSYTWSNGSTQQTLEVSSNGTYTLTLVDNNACSASDTITVIFNDLPALSVSASNPNPCVYDGIVQLNSTPSGGIWSGTGVTGDTFNPAIGVGLYDVFFDYTDSNGCSSTTTLSVSVDACASLVETENQYSISVYPNPATTEFYVSVNSSLLGVEMRLIDAAGRLVYTSSKQQIEQNQQVVIPVEKLEKGIYSLQINSNHGTSTVLISVNN